MSAGAASIFDRIDPEHYLPRDGRRGLQRLSNLRRKRSDLMSDDTPGYPEVQAMIEVAVERAVREARQRLWADVKLETKELRDEIRALREQVASALVEGGTLG